VILLTLEQTPPVPIVIRWFFCFPSGQKLANNENTRAMIIKNIISRLVDLCVTPDKGLVDLML